MRRISLVYMAWTHSMLALLLLSGRLGFCQFSGTTSTPLSPPQRVWQFSVSPKFSLIDATQTQNVYGGTFEVDNGTPPARICDPMPWNGVLKANSSHTHTSKPTGPSINLDAHDGQLTETTNLTRETFAHVQAELFLNNSLGLALEQAYFGTVRHNILKCSNPTADPKAHFHQILWAELGAGYFHQRFYASQPDRSLAALPLSQSYTVQRWSGLKDNTPRAMMWQVAETIQFVPMLNDGAAWQGYGEVTFSLPLAWKIAQFEIDEEDHYLEDAPRGFRRNYLKSSVGLTFSFTTKGK